MKSRNHALITGTGRAGTSFLVELLTHLGLDTGYTPEELIKKKYDIGRAGFEYDIRLENCPYIVKSPWFCDYAEEVFDREEIGIDHIFVPIRNLNAAAQSRIHVTKSGIKTQSRWSRFLIALGLRGTNYPGGIWHTGGSLKPADQELVLLNQLYKLMLASSKEHIPITLINYPLLTKDSEYLYKKLKPILTSISYEKFLEVFEATLKPELVHSFNSGDS